MYIISIFKNKILSPEHKDNMPNSKDKKES